MNADTNETDKADREKGTTREPVFDPTKISHHEVQRRLQLLGDLIHEDTYDYKKFKARATEVGIPVAILKQWGEAYQAFGGDGLKPDLSCLKPEEYPDIHNRLEQLRPEVDNETVSRADIQAIATRNMWSYAKAYRWVRRYRIGGEAALGKHGHPAQPNKRANESSADLGGLTDEELDEVFEKLELLGPLAKMKKLTTPDLEKRVAELRAQGIDKSKWTLRGYWSTLQKLGKAALRRKRRTDKNHYYKINADVIRAVRVFHLIYPALPATTLQEEVAKWAASRGFEPPSAPQVRRICKDISEALKLIAAGRYSEFRNKYKITHSLEFGFKVVFQIDWSQVPVYVRDLRDKRFRSSDGKVAPYLITVVEARSRRVLAWLLTYDRPDRFDIALVIRKAILVGGIPTEIWPDFGPELIAEHIKGITEALDVVLAPRGPNQPQQKGRVERPYQTFEDKLWSKNPGYFGHLGERGARKVAARDTIAELDARFAAYIENDYNHRPHSSLGQTPMEYWEQNIVTLSADPELLDILMMEAHTRKVGKAGIRFMNRTYWHPDLGGVADREVLIRSPERYFPPDEIMVFDGKKKVCLAYADDSEKGLMVSRADIAAAQRAQMRQLTDELKEAKVFASAMKADLQEVQAGETRNSRKKTGSDKTHKASRPNKQKGGETRSQTSRQAGVLERLRNKAKKEAPPHAGGENEEATQ